MPYGNVTARWGRTRKFLVAIEVPGHGGLSLSGRAETHVYSSPGISLEDSALRMESMACRTTIGRRRLR
jgi:hypothetical protein